MTSLTGKSREDDSDPAVVVVCSREGNQKVQILTQVR